MLKLQNNFANHAINRCKRHFFAANPCKTVAVGNVFAFFLLSFISLFVVLGPFSTNPFCLVTARAVLLGACFFCAVSLFPVGRRSGFFCCEGFWEKAKGIPKGTGGWGRCGCERHEFKRHGLPRPHCVRPRSDIVARQALLSTNAFAKTSSHCEEHHAWTTVHCWHKRSDVAIHAFYDKFACWQKFCLGQSLCHHTKSLRGRTQ